MLRINEVFSTSFDQLLEGIFQPSGRSEFGIHSLGDYIELYTEKKHLEAETKKLKKLLMKKTISLEQFKQQIQTYRAETQEIKRQSAKEALENSTRNRILANVGHELRTPINSISGTIGLLHSSQLTAEQRKLVTIMETCSQSLSSLINDLLDYSKIEAHALKLEQIEFNLEKAVKESIDLLMFSAREKNLQFGYRLATDLPTLLIGDPLRLRQILLNLAGNAIKFTKHGEVIILVEPADVQPNGVTVCFRVKDTGIGIPEHQQKNLFTSYMQTDASTTRKYGGTGLGLVISKELAELMGGQIGIEKSEGAGSTFWFTAHFLQPTSVKKISGESILVLEPSLPLAPKNFRILLVEDDLITRTVSSLLLRQSGQTRVDIAENGLVAIEKLQQSQYDLVLMDMCMPNMDGVEATRQIRQIGSGVLNPRVPIIAMTANTLDGDRAECLAAGMNGFISKPFKVDELNRIIGSYVQDSTGPDEKVEDREAEIELPTIDFAKLNQMQRDIDEKFEPLVRQFLNNLSGKLKQIHSAIEDNNSQKLKEAAHKLRGTCACFYAEKMVDLCLKMERSTPESMINAAYWLDLLEKEVQSVTENLNAKIQSG